MYYVPLAFHYIYGCSDEGSEDVDGKRRESGPSYAHNLVLYGESEEDLGAMVGWFVDVCRRRGLKVNAGKSKVMVMNGEKGLKCEEVHVGGICLEHVSEIKYLGCVLDKSGTDGAKFSRKVVSGRRVAVTIRSLVKARVLHEHFVVPVLMYGSETMLWKEEERSRTRAVQMDNLRDLLGIRRMDSPKCMDK